MHSEGGKHFSSTFAPRRMSRATSAPINALPPSVLELVFEHFARRPLLLIVSLVCRHWRSTALRCVRHLRLTEVHLTSPVAQRTLDLLTGLQTITYEPREIPSHPGRLLVPSPSLTALNFIYFNHDPPLALPPLRRISGQHVVVDYFTALLQRSQSTLESLDIFSVPSEAHAKSLASLHLPALTELSLRRGWSRALLPLLTCHATQLTTLTIYDNALRRGLGGGTAADELVSLSFPRLRRLIVYHERLSAAQLTRLLTAAPQLIKLSVFGIPAIAELPRALLTSLVSCHLSKPLTAPQMALLDSLPRLHTLGLSEKHSTARSLLHTLSDVALHRLRDVQISTDAAADVWELLAKTSNVRVLELRTTDPLTDPATFPPNYSLAKLRFLSVDFQGMRLTVSNLVAVLNQLLSVAPFVEKVTVRFNGSALEGDAAPLLALVRGLLRRCCSFVTLGGGAACYALLGLCGETAWAALSINPGFDARP